ncbi:hypothetical protein CGRA01v4_14568 [Colletotrichum graminicola]|nr:hypothetical protein CGRA01v4_14568 [Colletotrichum graminicola]
MIGILHVWLYIFSKNYCFPSWSFRGFLVRLCTHLPHLPSRSASLSLRTRPLTAQAAAITLHCARSLDSEAVRKSRINKKVRSSVTRPAKFVRLFGSFHVLTSTIYHSPHRLTRLPRLLTTILIPF